jgi:hypothetical protein
MPTWHQHLSRYLPAAIATLIAMMLLPAQSTAGVYHVYSCRIPYGPMAGDAAPVQDAEGEVVTPGQWSHIASGTAIYGNSCSSGGSLIAALPAGTTHSTSDLSRWIFNAPTDTTIKSASVWRAGDADGGSGYVFWLAAPHDPAAAEAITSEDTFDGCAFSWSCPHPGGLGDALVPLAEQNEVTSNRPPGSELYINASCERALCPSSETDSNGYASVVYVYATDIALEQQSSPAVTNVSGELAEAEQVSGTASLFFKASDAGSGVYREIVSVDGTTLESPVIDETELCKEVPVPAEDAPAFLSAQPCPAQANGRVSLHAENLSNGDHHLLVEVTDAAGNATTALSKTIKVVNGATSPPGGDQLPTTLQTPTGVTGSTSAAGGTAGAQSNGTPASDHPTLTAAWVRSTGAQISGTGNTRLSGAYRHAETVTGRLTGSGGEAIADATILVSARKSYGGAKTISLGSVRTDSSGRFTIHLARQSPSEQLQISYSPTISGTPVVSRTLLLKVQAALELNVTPTSASVGKSIRLRGRILGEPIPPGGKQVVLEARSQGSRWLQFLVLRSGRSGRFEGTHRFRLPGPVRYFFRAVCPEEADFPFTTGISNQVAVWER